MALMQLKNAVVSQRQTIPQIVRLGRAETVVMSLLLGAGLH